MTPRTAGSATMEVTAERASSKARAVGARKSTSSRHSAAMTFGRVPPAITPAFTVTPSHRPFSPCRASTARAAARIALCPFSGSTPACAARPWKSITRSTTPFRALTMSPLARAHSRTSAASCSANCSRDGVTRSFSMSSPVSMICFRWSAANLEHHGSVSGCPVLALRASRYGCMSAMVFSILSSPLRSTNFTSTESLWRSVIAVCNHLNWTCHTRPNGSVARISAGPNSYRPLFAKSTGSQVACFLSLSTGGLVNKRRLGR